MKVFTCAVISGALLIAAIFTGMTPGLSWMAGWLLFFLFLSIYPLYETIGELKK